jgi:hypothetical protein
LEQALRYDKAESERNSPFSVVRGEKIMRKRCLVLGTLLLLSASATLYSTELKAGAGVFPVPEAVTCLISCSPNPFDYQTTISYTTREPARTSLEIYNSKGQKIRTLLVEVAKSESHTIIWNRKNGAGNLVSSGVYFFKLSSGKYSSTRKIVLLK